MNTKEWEGFIKEVETETKRSMHDGEWGLIMGSKLGETPSVFSVWRKDKNEKLNITKKLHINGNSIFEAINHKKDIVNFLNS
jgi:hypothetical protein